MFEQAEEYYDGDTFELVPDSERECTCCFSGHRALTAHEREVTLYRLRSTVLWLVSRGITTFRAGGALGFDTIAATTVVDLARTNGSMKLILDLPFPGQAELWSDKDRRIYEFLLDKADKVNYYGRNPVGRAKASDCMMKRNRAMVDNAAVCVCFCKSSRGGTAYTVDYAKKKDLEIINLAQSELTDIAVDNNRPT